MTGCKTPSPQNLEEVSVRDNGDDVRSQNGVSKLSDLGTGCVVDKYGCRTGVYIIVSLRLAKEVYRYFTLTVSTDGSLLSLQIRFIVCNRDFAMATTTQTTSPAKFSTTADLPIPRGDVKSTLTFYAPPADGSKPWNYVEKPTTGPQRNYGENPHEVTIHDIRGNEVAFDLNIHGFTTIANVPSRAHDFTSDSHIKDVYYPEVERLLLEHVPGANKVFLFDHTIRRSDPTAPRAPVTRAHIDQTAASARARVHLHMGDDLAPILLRGRVRIINVWRPLNGPVVATPLAFADSRSVPDEDVVAVEHRYPTRTGETAGVKYGASGQWYYWSGMGNEERVLLQCFDSRDGARTPHSAFVDPRTPEGWPGRESIEVRALVFG